MADQMLPQVVSKLWPAAMRQSLLSAFQPVRMRPNTFSAIARTRLSASPAKSKGNVSVHLAKGTHGYNSP